MSKAFVKEDADSDSDADLDEEGPSLAPGTKNYMTPSGASRMQGELKQLLNVDRPKVVETVAWAASNGDRSENADYIYGKRRLREIDRRIRFLTKRLEAAEVVAPEKQKSDQVLFGATVTIRNEEEQKKTFRIVGIDETRPAEGRVSWTSPIGKALLGAKVGDIVNFRTPKGDEELEVLKIEYLPLD